MEIERVNVRPWVLVKDASPATMKNEFFTPVLFKCCLVNTKIATPQETLPKGRAKD
jgi:hypothetical protein